MNYFYKKVNSSTDFFFLRILVKRYGICIHKTDLSAILVHYGAGRCPQLLPCEEGNPQRHQAWKPATGSQRGAKDCRFWLVCSHTVFQVLAYVQYMTSDFVLQWLALSVIFDMVSYSCLLRFYYVAFTPCPGDPHCVEHSTTCLLRWLRGKLTMKRWTCGVWESCATSSWLENPHLKQRLTMRPTAGFQRYDTQLTGTFHCGFFRPGARLYKPLPECSVKMGTKQEDLSQRGRS